MAALLYCTPSYFRKPRLQRHAGSSTICHHITAIMYGALCYLPSTSCTALAVPIAQLESDQPGTRHEQCIVELSVFTRLGSRDDHPLMPGRFGKDDPCMARHAVSPRKLKKEERSFKFTIYRFGPDAGAQANLIIHTLVFLIKLRAIKTEQVQTHQLSM